ncbi:MAG TPA: peptidylprolyl isomerase [Steroidobacteraceae bacterium]|nr:peptidylprolyl isomerase [Steroidobacteraceae bacterium]
MHYSRLFLLVTALVALAACQPKGTATTAATGSDTSPAVATVNGVPISRDFYEFYIKGITQGKSSAELSPQQRAAALDNLIRARLVGEEAVKQGLDKSSDNAYLLELSRLNVLQQAVEQNYLKDRKPTEQELRAEYESQVQAMPKTEYHARHILVANEGDAKKLIERLDKGEKFDVLAKSESIDPSKSTGGDLGWFSPERMMPEFAGAVIAMKPGEYTHNPVHTQYGWHVIQLLDTREVSPPGYDQVKGRLDQIVQAKKFRSYTDDLMKTAKVEKLLDQPAAAPPAGAAPAAPAAPAPAQPSAPAPAPAPAQPTKN